MILVPLKQIKPNPWQPRQDEDADHIKALAENIRANRYLSEDKRGLLQIPVARLIDHRDDPLTGLQAVELMAEAQHNTHLHILWTHDVYVQLAFGHSRLAAFRLLETKYPTEHWDEMPLEVVFYGDLQMATAAWTENAQRKDLNPAEEAHAIHKMMTDFGWTQEKAAETLSLNRSTIANKLRLLKLPDDVQSQLRDGSLSERQAIALLPLYELPQASRDGIAQDQKYYTSIHPENIVKEAHKLNSDDLRSRVKSAVEHATKSLKDAIFPLDIPVVGPAAALRPVACSDCECLLTSNKEKRCSDRGCFDAKSAQWQTTLLEEASAATGIPIVQNTDWQLNTTFVAFRDLDLEALALAIQEQCPNLTLRYHSNGAPVDKARFPGVGYNCHYKAGGRCECQHMLEQRAKSLLLAATQEAKETLYRDAIQPATALFVQALERGDLTAWRAIARTLHVAESDVNAAATVLDIWELIVQRFLTGSMYQDPRRYPNECRAHVEERLKIAGLFLGKPLSQLLD